MSCELYFAYGSNMCTARLRARLPCALPVGSAVLPGWELTYDKRSVDGSGKCTVRPSGREAVHGVLFEIDSLSVEVLDRIEGAGYERLTVTVAVACAQVEAVSYVARDSWIDVSVAPYDWYVGYVLAGAREHSLPASYVDTTLAAEPVADPDLDRTRLHRAALDSG